MARSETTVGFEVLPLGVKMSVNEFMAKHKVDYATANGVIKFLVEKELASKIGTTRTASRGKPTNVYDLPKECLLKVA